MIDITPEKLAPHCRDEKQAKLRAKQLRRHYFERFETNPAQMTDIPREQAEQLCKIAFPEALKAKTEQIGDAGSTVKTLFELADGEAIEAVLMYYPDRATLCLSCQVGCAMACPFCATGKLGLKRNLTAFEMIEQARLAAKAALEKGSRLTNIVFMGMGEPTQNLEHISAALDAICGTKEEFERRKTAQSEAELENPGSSASKASSEKPKKASSFGINAKNITISTVGNVRGIKALAKDPRPFRLAISLHAPEDQLRNELVPINRTFDIDAVLNAGFDYFKASGRRVSIEYALMRDINDSEKQAFKLAKILNQKGSGWAHVNLIPLNEIEGSKWTASTPIATLSFVSALQSKGINATLRDSRGQDIDGACGQLAGKSAA